MTDPRVPMTPEEILHAEHEARRLRTRATWIKLALAFVLGGLGIYLEIHGALYGPIWTMWLGMGLLLPAFG